MTVDQHMSHFVSIVHNLDEGVSGASVLHIKIHNDNSFPWQHSPLN